ncbi:MAG TPA: type II secretion system protein [Thermoanaerobaculia bacterium]|nr:type II secretion system protein [Thermoanaerobaculia bacterium]
MRADARSFSREGGFTLVEMLVVVFLLAITMVALLAVFDASTRINKSEQEIADAQGQVRYGVYQMIRVIRMAGAGGLFVTQAVLTAPDPGLGGITAPDGTYDNVTGGSVTNLAGVQVPVRPGTDMIEVRGVILSPLLGFDLTSGCGTCTGVSVLDVRPVVRSDAGGQHVNHHATNRPQFAAIDSHTAGASAERPVFVVVAANDDLHSGCSDPRPGGLQRNPQATYNVGLLTSPTTLVASNTFGSVDFGNGLARQLSTEMPSETVPLDPAPAIVTVRRAGVLDDILYFIDDTDPQHPALARGIRRGARFDVAAVADDVENMQIAYGVDGLYGGDAVLPDDALGRVVAVTGEDTDPNVSTLMNGDEWAPNVAGEAMFVPTDFQSQQPAPVPFTHASVEDCHGPRLLGVMISLVAKSRNPDPTYRAPLALGLRTMNSPAEPSLYPTPLTSPRYRRRIQLVKISLRNYAFTG